MIGFWIFTIIK